MIDDRRGAGRDDGPSGGDAADERALRAAFEAARAEGDPEAPLPEGLAARLLADAEAARPAPARHAARRAGWGRHLAELIPLWPRAVWATAGGLAACAAVGLWLGYAPPPGFDRMSAALLGGPALSSGDLLVPLDAGGLDV
jgi:hypothetical protein